MVKCIRFLISALNIFEHRIIIPQLDDSGSGTNFQKPTQRPTLV